MRKLEQKISDAFRGRLSRKIVNTRTDGDCVWLHGNKIVMRMNKVILFNACGWITRTTVSRINAIIGGGLRISNKRLIYNGKQIMDNEWAEA